MLFAGHYYCKVDEKGRFIVPPTIRQQIAPTEQTVVFVKGAEQSLWVYTSSEWEKVLDRMRAKLDEDQSRLFMHFVVSDSGTSDIDKAGRVLIPGRLRKMIPLDEEQEIVLVGMYHRIELWSMSEWRRYVAKNEDRYEESRGRITDLL
ncbi:MAG: hypothetical protein U0172_06620 [Nitrospiraceae bacterium]